MWCGGKDPSNKSQQEDPLPKIQSIAQARGDLSSPVKPQSNKYVYHCLI